MSTKICKKCERVLPIEAFAAFGNCIRYSCRECRNAQRRENMSATTKAAHRMRKEKDKKSRRTDVAKTIYLDSRNSDRKKEFDNDLTVPFIEELISEPCFYCETTELRMTLDRVDNSRGHTKNNVVPSCIRCNHVRGNMPIEAWVHIVPAMKSAYNAGAFGEWRSVPFPQQGILNAAKSKDH